ncbi:MAG: thiamine diphosphokinase [Paracoccaceae bacterium]|nr:thiamine diphosphokinase [Paracoccaceae bacterium]MDG1738159.1 thiamine diphosphokinase [Paracoccaceae bacterium]MDG2259413.1 thiamine diphosphokinase [Paracoccaceae bacterium]
MKPHIVHSSEPIALFGGGDADQITIARALEIAPTVVAADGGANLAVLHNIQPKAVIGDLDSIHADTLAKLPDDVLFKIEEQDSTDFDKALRSILAPIILAVGFTGARLDHQLAALTTLICHPEKRCLILGPLDLVFLAPPNMQLDLPVGTIASLFPMAPVTGRSSGLRWPIDGISFSPANRIGTSNEVSGPLHLEFDSPNMLVILPMTALDQVIAAFALTDAHWTARAE